MSKRAVLGIFTKVAVLIGMTVLIGGAEISNAKATTCEFGSCQTTPQTQTFNLSFPILAETSSPALTLTFTGFDTSLGTLTDVQVFLNSTVSVFRGIVSASATVAGQSIGNSGFLNGADPPFNKYPFNAGAFFFTSLDSFTGPSVTADLFLSTHIAATGVTWSGTDNGPGSAEAAGLIVIYDYTPTPTPLPAALPLFATGLGGLGLLGWRRKRKTQTVA